MAAALLRRRVGGAHQRARPSVLHRRRGAARPVSPTLFMHTLAQRRRRLMLALEHRFYGESWPTPDMSNANLKYLSSEQALADRRPSSRRSPTARRRASTRRCRGRRRRRREGLRRLVPRRPLLVAQAEVPGVGRRRRRARARPCTPRPTSPSTWASSAPRCGRRRSAAPPRATTPCATAPPRRRRRRARAAAERQGAERGVARRARGAARLLGRGSRPLLGARPRGVRRRARSWATGRRWCSTTRLDAARRARRVPRDHERDAAERRAAAPRRRRASTRRGSASRRVGPDMAAPLAPRQILAARLQPHVRLRPSVDAPAGVQRVWLLPDGGRPRPPFSAFGALTEATVGAAVCEAAFEAEGRGVGAQTTALAARAGAERDGAQRLARPVARARPRRPAADAFYDACTKRRGEAPPGCAQQGVDDAALVRLDTAHCRDVLSPNAGPRSASALPAVGRAGPRKDRRRRGKVHRRARRRRRRRREPRACSVCVCVCAVLSYNLSNYLLRTAFSARDVCASTPSRTRRPARVRRRSRPPYAPRAPILAIAS